jgi:hypothetical protein
MVLALRAEPSGAVAESAQDTAMELSRDRFVDQFAITFGVHCLRHWSTRHKAAPTYLAPCFYGWIKTNGGLIGLSAAEFAEVAEPIIEDASPHAQGPAAGCKASRRPALRCAGRGKDRGHAQAIRNDDSSAVKRPRLTLCPVNRLR